MLICVPTPINELSKIPNLNYVKEVILKLKTIDLTHKLIIFECTSYPGTTEEMFLPLAKQKKLVLGDKIFLGNIASARILLSQTFFRKKYS